MGLDYRRSKQRDLGNYARYEQVNELYANVKGVSDAVPVEKWTPPDRSPRSLNRTRYYRLRERACAANLRRIQGLG